jgi:hypothetical protein
LCYSFFCSRSNFPLCSRLRFSSSVRHGLTAASSFFDSFFCSAPAHSGPSVFIFGAGFGSSSVRCPDFFVDSSIAPKRAVVILGSRRTRWFLLRVFISSGWPPSSACNPLNREVLVCAVVCHGHARSTFFPLPLVELTCILYRSRSKVSTLFLSFGQGPPCILFCPRSASSFHQAKVSLPQFCFPVPARSCHPIFIAILGNPCWATLWSSVVANACCRFWSRLAFDSAS